MGQVVTILRDPQDVAFTDADLSARHHTDQAAAQDPFTRAVAQAGTDICILHNSPPAPVAEWLLCLLAAFGQLGRRVTSARLLDDRIALTVDGVRLVMGQVARLDMEALDYYRPQMPRAARKTGLLGHYLSRHAAVCRLRIDHKADPEMTQDICGLLLRFHAPVAVILNPDRLVLTGAEYAAATPDALRRMQRGPRIAPLPRRYNRPRMDRVESALPALPQARAQQPGIFAHHRRRDAGQAAQAAVRAPLGKGRLVALAFCAAKTEDSLTSVFRARAVARAVPLDACRADSMKAPRLAPSALDDALVCDAIQLSARGKTLRLVAPLLMATMVLLTNLHHAGASPDQQATQTMVTPTGGGPA